MQGINYIAAFGQNTGARYPYSSASGTTGTCQTGLLNFPTGGGVQVSGSAELITPQNDEEALMKAVALAPTTVYFDVESSFQSYAGGVYHGQDCGETTNHASECSSMTHPFPPPHIYLSALYRMSSGLSPCS